MSARRSFASDPRPALSCSCSRALHERQACVYRATTHSEKVSYRIYHERMRLCGLTRLIYCTERRFDIGRCCKAAE